MQKVTDPLRTYVCMQIFPSALLRTHFRRLRRREIGKEEWCANYRNGRERARFRWLSAAQKALRSISHVSDVRKLSPATGIP
jgi:hypothetical protein